MCVKFDGWIMLAELLTLDFSKEKVFSNVSLGLLMNPDINIESEPDSIDEVIDADANSDTDANITSELDEIAKAIKQIKEEFMPSFAYNHDVMIPQDTGLDYGQLWHYKSNVSVAYSDVEYKNKEDEEDSDLRYDSGVVMKIQETRKIANYVLGAAHNVMSNVTGINSDDGISITQKEKHDLNKYTSYFFMLNIIAYETAF